MKNFDAIVIGAGQAGPFLAARMVEKGMKVALIERKFLGGTCVNAGCMPTKTLVASARAAHVARSAAAYGVNIGGEIAIDMKVVRARAETVTMNARNGLIGWFAGMDGISVIYGHARFEGPKTVSVNGETLTAPRIFLNVGARPVIPELPGIDDIDYLTSTSIIQLDTLPRHLAVIGGSYIGLEFAQMYRRFGAEVSVIEHGPKLASREDEDISDAIAEILRSEGIGVHTDSGNIAFAGNGKGVSVIAGSAEIDASHVLIATGRKPNTDDLGLDAAGVATDKRGYITVDDKLATNVEGIFALGDCNGHGAFTHTSYNDFEIAAANLLDGDNRKLSSRIPAYALYIDPPLGRVGMTEKQARGSGRRIMVSTRPMSRVGRANERGETKGFMKVIADAETKEILGAAILGIEGDEVIHGLIDAMNAGTPYPTLKWSVPIHPTVSELIPTLLGDLKPV
ncbi:FAD-containing oxidoreductase [Rhizobium binae]|uniref:Pyruvate/2-oxoglutarate dehydrogenase complex dihydrolipoamide dehydrogenase (E3) component n=1 Tax=Rhizobium binae TaxID=1138190 RepID=A0ABV2MGM8_9HYPH|nr:FAD-containing oxidoreductase [Rhizobium binae]NKL51076.1 FAD-containing oxidoreductase [Rhizobium leguminosarum bv. viciae]MBX4940474.1 FAD-containing oxidoreductase [Rhizobium binae]MBX4947003.1 FAD-containing oxidoreductase [Rhizobium binae]MBX4949960.1 FAD-containing oxidoreductase [Rhizobium binae]MBX4960892.1 FAD-containing oxidoreductase [Rhizobium binae]